MSLIFSVTGRRKGDGVAIAADIAPTMGIVRLDNNAVIFAAGHAMTFNAADKSYSLAVPADLEVPGKTYRGTWVGTWGGKQVSNFRDKVSSTPAAVDSYLSVTEADVIASALPNVAAYIAANATAKANALQAASDRIDVAMPYQGRKYSESQARQFPRVPYRGRTDVWDIKNGSAVVPSRVRVACVLEANSVLAADRDDVLDAQHNGLASQSIGGASESYVAGFTQKTICRRAHELLVPYLLHTGDLL